MAYKAAPIPALTRTQKYKNDNRYPLGPSKDGFGVPVKKRPLHSNGEHKENVENSASQRLTPLDNRRNMTLGKGAPSVQSSKRDVRSYISPLGPRKSSLETLEPYKRSRPTTRSSSVPVISPMSFNRSESGTGTYGDSEKYLQPLKSPDILQISPQTLTWHGNGSDQNMSNRILPDGVIDIDALDEGDFLSEHRFALHIHSRMLERESMFQIDPSYMDRQSEVSEKMRAILVDWLVDVHRKFDLSEETLHLTVWIIDKFLEQTAVPRRNLQLIGVTAALIASKYEEIYPPLTSDFVYITDRAYTEEQILQTEILVLNKLQFRVTMPSTVRFLERNLKVLRVLGGDSMITTCNLARYCVNLSLQYISALQYRSSERAAAAVILAISVFSETCTWNPTLNYHAGRVDPETLQRCVVSLAEMLRREHDRENMSKLTAVHRKFSSEAFSAISTKLSQTSIENSVKAAEGPTARIT